MSRVKRPLLALVFLACASFARAGTLHLLAPANGVTLRGGTFAELRWSASSLPASTEEWEAFLSINGGKYYAFRVTPHLDIDLQRFTFLVPNVDTRDARILIRTGNEIEETHFESRGSFSIVRDARADEVLPRLLQFGRGEAARDGDPAVLSWAEGARNGSGVTQQSSSTLPFPSVDAVTTVANDTTAALPTSGKFRNAIAPISIATAALSVRDRHARNSEPLPIAADLLLMCRRRNI